MTREEHAYPDNDENDWHAWIARFQAERQAILDTIDVGVLENDWHNAGGRHRWWDDTVHTVASAIAAARRHAGTPQPPTSLSG